jgi:hypothetical protein
MSSRRHRPPVDRPTSRAPADRRGGGVSFTVMVDGVEVTAQEGQTVAGLLLALGKDSWRDTRRNGRPRGVFCGIGVCFDCLVVVNGAPDVRACQRTLAPGDVIRAQHGAELPDAAR